ncbi:UNVERIFIED_CONTAM: hypothetical protein Slati_3089800 [Sesamum latifolium]|uniref:Aminotransferase-like plant mobile domain-containing protein n=1 Tax=Sesamum latifolium TaxID=2727402 RepID=A0AAW2UTW8_9LAMI
MDFEDRTEPFLSIIIRSGKDILKSMHIHEWSEEVTRDTLDPRSNVSSQTKVLLLKSSLHDVKADTKFILPNRHLAAIGTSWRTPQSRYGEGPLRYAAPPLRSSRKRVHEFKLSRNPSGDVDASNLPRTKDHDEPFTILQIPENIQDETYVAAFLSCWLCNFVLPHNKVGKGHVYFHELVRVFSYFSHPLRIWLDRTLSSDSLSSKLEPIGAQMVKYAVENMARHFQPTEARNLFHRINPSRLLNFYFHHQGPSLVADDAKISNTFKHLFVALRSSYLTLRLGVESIVEAYSPHHFSRQFGFCQDVPGSLKKEILTCSLKELGRPWQSCTLSGTSSKLFIPGSVSSSPLVTKEYADWWAKCNTNSLEKSTRVILKLNHPPDLEKGSKDNQVMPATETDAAKPVATTSKRRHNVLVDTPVAPLSSENDVISALSISNGQLSNPQPLEKVFDLDTISVNSSFFQNVPSSFMPLNELALYLAGLEEGVPVTPEDDHLSVETPSKPPKIVLPAIMEKPPLLENVLEKSKKTFEAPSRPYSSTEVNDFCPQLIKTAAEQMLLKFYWERICQKIMTTPIEQLLEVRPVIDALIKEMGIYMKDTSPLESHLKVFFDGASNYARTKLESSHEVTREVYEESLSLAKDDLFAVEAKEKEHAKEVESLEAEVLQVVNQQGVLKKQLEELQRKEELINSSLHGAKGALINFQKDVATKKEKI